MMMRRDAIWSVQNLAPLNPACSFLNLAFTAFRVLSRISQSLQYSLPSTPLPLPPFPTHLVEG